MNDYGTLAEILKGSGHAEHKISRDRERQGFDSGAFFEEVKVHILSETEKANAELHKRRLAPIERVFVPCYLGRLCLTFGPVLMCCIELDAARERVRAIIVGPPNRREISRREFSLERLRIQGFAKLNGETIRGDDRNAAAVGPGAMAADIVSEIIKTGIRLIEQRSKLADSAALAHDEPHFAEFWISLASLLRSYSALHSVSGTRQAEVETAEKTITVRHAEKSLLLMRHHATVTWTRENGCTGVMAFTDHGTLRSDDADEAMDMVAEQWARELMQHEPLVQIGN